MFGIEVWLGVLGIVLFIGLFAGMMFNVSGKMLHAKHDEREVAERVELVAPQPSAPFFAEVEQSDDAVVDSGTSYAASA